MKREEVINSLELEDYLNNFINDGDNCLQEKIKMSIFLNEFMDKKLFVVEFITDNKLYIRVENEDDEILSSEFYLGEIVYKKPTIEDIELSSNIFEEHIRNMAKEYDEFLFKNLDKIEHKFVGYKIKPTIPTIDNTIMNEYSIKCSNIYQFVGFDNLKEMKHWLEEGYSICEKSDLEKVRGLI